MKHFDIILFDDAIIDIQNGLEYYTSISPAIAKKFLAAVKNTFAELKINPFYQVRYDNVRMRKVKGFPYLLHFVLNENQNSVIIYGIRNAAQNPDTSYFFSK